MGTTNSGKSALINAMLYTQSKQKRVSSNTKKRRNEAIQLTESALPGTTQEMITIEQFKIGFRVIDTPGIPNVNQVISRVSSFKELAKLLPQKEMTVFPINVKSGYTIWLGALARLDMISGDDKHLTCIVPQDVTIHRTPIIKASTVFIAQADKLLKPSYFRRSELEDEEEAKEANTQKAEQILSEMVKYEISLNCTNFKLANFDIVIDGLGWVSVQGKGFVNFILHLPPDINYHIRDQPMQPYEADTRKLKRYTGNTINARTRKNKA